GRLGLGLSDNDTHPVPAQIPELIATTGSAGRMHFIVMEPGGTIKTFGGNDNGQLGVGTSDISPHPSPVLVPGLSGVFATAAGEGSTFALVGNPTTGGTIRAWGHNLFGMLGIDSLLQAVKPAVVLENLTVASPIFSVPEGTMFATQVHIACGTPGAVIHYTTNGSDPTESDPVIASGSPVTVGQSLTLKARAFRSGFAASAVKSATYTVVAMPSIHLLLDESGPALDQVAALDSLLFLRDPFPVVNLGDLLNQGTDRNTRVIVFTKDLLLPQGAPASSVLVNLVDSNNQTFDVAAEEVRSLPGTEFVQVTFRLPDTLAVGTCTLRIKLLDRVSNAGTIRIKA
ncbi:MAG TPA: chitobiase/beta-hexosaminidase C-terminal domain-containing protein, partial [Pyrinomonadaceae bacterium]|nr:chitobiase/beta-hexosaminidase C-terminal domain-containing protein [Pyrinomonadaceae bacterium]